MSMLDPPSPALTSNPYALGGLKLEQTTTNLTEYQEALFWLSCDQGIIEKSPLFELYQHILGCITHQLNQPQLDNDQYFTQENV